jgi:DHA2 family multidrug resistance protein
MQGVALWHLSAFPPDLSFGDAAMGRLFQSIALPFLFVPVNTVAYVGIDPAKTNDASALLNVARNLGGTIGISTSQTLLLNQQQVHQSQMVEGLNPLNPSYTHGLNQIVQTIAGGPSPGMNSATGLLYEQVQRQATMLSYIDVYHVFMIVVFLIAPLALILRPPKPGAAPAH